MNEKIKEINILATDNRWYRLVNNPSYEASDKEIAMVILSETAIRVWRIDVLEEYATGDWFSDYVIKGNPLYLNTALIVGIEIVRENNNKAESEE